MVRLTTIAGTIAHRAVEFAIATARGPHRQYHDSPGAT
jgi:hypothetical protein